MQIFLLPLALIFAAPAAGPVQPAEPVVQAEQPAEPVPATAEKPAQEPSVSPTPAPSASAPAAAPSREIVVTAEPPPPSDPLQAFNADSFETVQQLDEALVAPAARAYQKATPRGLRKGLRNFFQNLREPIAAINYLLQLKIGKSLETVGRFGINSTLGIAGLVDVAKKAPFNLPRRPNGFANTLGFYGVKPGAYFYLPLIGSTTVRDLLGGTVDTVLLAGILPAPIDRPIVAIPGGVLSALDHRIEHDEEIRRVNEGSDNPYRTTREEYLARRQTEIDALKAAPATPAATTDEARAAAPEPAPQPR